MKILIYARIYVDILLGGENSLNVHAYTHGETDLLDKYDLVVIFQLKEKN